MHWISTACFFTNLFDFVLFLPIYLGAGFTFLESLDSRLKLTNDCSG